MVVLRPSTMTRAGASPSRPPRSGATPRTAATGGFRRDIEGLRGVAVAAVLLYHAGVPLFAGGYVGVDVFFVISGFLITGLLLAEIERTGTVSVRRFYARRVRRLLPSVLVVLAAVAVLSWFFLPPVRRALAAGDIVVSGLYAINWRLASRAVDYFAAGADGSPVQHFWSLAVEEQFYLVWPALLLAVTWPRRRAGRNVRPVLTLVLALLAAASFGYGVHLTRTEAGAAYFSTFARGWELALGGLVALALAAVRRSIPRPVAAALSVAGLGAIVAAAVLYGDDTPFPGTAALLPTLGAAAVVAAGSAAAPVGVQRLLVLAPVRHVGRVSYTWYLWHWPPLVFAQAHWGRLSPAQGLLVVAVSYVPTLLTHRLVEEPFRRADVFARMPCRAFELAVVATGAAVGIGLALQTATPTLRTAPVAKAVGAKALERTTAMQLAVSEVRPAPHQAAGDRGATYHDGCMVMPRHTTSPPCVYGDRSSKTTVVLFGDPHAMQWFPALDRVARRRHWRLVDLTKSACPPAGVQVYMWSFKREYSECDTWKARAFERIARLRPALVVTSGLTGYTVVQDGHRLHHTASRAALESGWVATLRRLQETGARVVVMKETPHQRSDVIDCVSEHPQELEKCAVPVARAYAFTPVETRAAERVDGVDVIDARPELCPNGVCPGVIGDVLVYRLGGHLTATYVRTLDRWLGRRLPDRLPGEAG